MIGEVWKSRMFWKIILAIFIIPPPAAYAVESQSDKLNEQEGERLLQTKFDVHKPENAKKARWLLDTLSEKHCGLSASANLKEHEKYRYLIEINDYEAPSPANGKPWRVTIQSGFNEIDDPDYKEFNRGAPFQLVLTDKNTRPGLRFLTPVFGVGGARACVKIDEGTPPPIRVIHVIRTASYPAEGLSIAGPRPGSTPNWIGAQSMWDDCKPENECAQVYETTDWLEGDDPSLKVQQLWSSEARKPNGNDYLNFDDRKNNLKRAVSAVIWLGSEKYMPLEDDSAGGSKFRECTESSDCMGHCTGFFVAKRLILTNAHCLISLKTNGESSNPKDLTMRHTLRGWIRAYKGDPYALERPPDLQFLTPVFVGKPHYEKDYALLWVEDKNFHEYATFPATLPDKLPVADISDPEDLVIVGYPLNNALKMSFDGYCKRFGKDKNYLIHKCDTAGGNSGSPVFDRNLNAVIGLHFGGFVIDENGDFKCDGDNWDNCKNYAVFVSKIRTDIRKKMKDAKLWRFVIDDCASGTPGGAEMDKALSTKGYEMWKLPGGFGPTEETLIKAYKALPTALKPKPPNSCSR